MEKLIQLSTKPGEPGNASTKTFDDKALQLMTDFELEKYVLERLQKEEPFDERSMQAMLPQVDSNSLTAVNAVVGAIALMHEARKLLQTSLIVATYGTHNAGKSFVSRQSVWLADESFNRDTETSKSVC